MKPPSLYLRTAFGIALVGILLLYVDIHEVTQHVLRVKAYWIAAAALCIVLSTVLGSLNIYILLDRADELPFRRFVPIFWTAWAMSLIVPGQVGDVASISLMLRRYNIEVHTSLGRSLLDKAISLALTASVALAALPTVADFTLGPKTGLKWMAAGCAVALILGLAARQMLGEKMDPEAAGLLGFVARTVREIQLTARRHPGRIAINVVLTALKIGLLGLAYWCAFRALGYSDLPLTGVIPLVAASSLVAYLPLSVNGLGTAEAAGVLLFASLALPNAAILSAYLMLRFLVFVLGWTPAGLWMVFWRQAAHQPLS